LGKIENNIKPKKMPPHIYEEAFDKYGRYQ